VTRLTIDTRCPLFPVEEKLFGHFTEHAFGNIYGGLYDPDSPMADEAGLRRDVLEAVRRVHPRILRYPGGNFVSNYHWEDGIGPKENRKRVFEYAWLTEESNQFGTADFIGLCRKIGAEPLICVNMGSGTPEEAMHWVEYCNGTGNTYYANLRRQHGYEEPFGVKYWGLGNEMYGPWQMQNLSAEDYAKSAFQFAKAIRWVDPSVKLVACGLQDSADWNYTVMKAIGPMVDYLSAHHYAVGWGPFEDHSFPESMTIADHMERLHRLTLSAMRAGMNDPDLRCRVAWDEWNMFGWVVPGVNEDARYTLTDAIVTALILSMFIRNSDTIGMANYSTFVNINGAVKVHGDRLVLRAQYPVFELLSEFIGKQVLDVRQSGPKMTVPSLKASGIGRPPLGINLSGAAEKKPDTAQVPVLDCTAAIGEDGQVLLCIINKSLDADIPLGIKLQGMETGKCTASVRTIFHESVDAANTLENPDCVRIAEGFPVEVRDGMLHTCIHRHSVNLMEIR